MALRLAVVLLCAASWGRALALPLGGPVVIRTGLGKAQQQGQHDQHHHSDVGVQKGIANYEGESGFNNNNENKLVSAQDAGHYGDAQKTDKGHVDQNQFKDEKFHNAGGGHVTDFGARGAHKKGHHKSGFSNSYHKDETGSNNSFYDDSEDQGDQYIYRSNKGAFGDAAARRAHGGTYDNARVGHDEARRGHYDNAGRYEKGLNDQRGYDRRNYYDGREQQARRQAGRGYDGRHRYDEEQYYAPQYHPHQGAGGPGYYHEEPYYERPYVPLPSVPDQRIIIYEDPRYQDIKYPAYDDQRLDIRRPAASRNYRYFEPPPPASYDYYY